jgi:xylulokinase
MSAMTERDSASAALIAALDFGTSSVKVALVEADGTVLAAASTGYQTATGTAGQVEQNPNDWWAAAASTLIGFPTELRNRIVVLGATGQMQDLIPVRETTTAPTSGRGDDAVIRPALLYSDTRAAAQFDRLVQRFPDWEHRTGNQQETSAVAAKIAWLGEFEPETLNSATTLFLGAPGYILWRAGGAAVCDLTTASTTGLLDVANRGWFTELVADSGASVHQLPQLLSSAEPASTVVGELSATAAAQLGLPAGIPLVAALGDAGSTTDGLVGSQPGDAYLYLGTTGWLAQVGRASESGESVLAAGQQGTAVAAPHETQKVDRPSPIHSLVLPGWETRIHIGALLSAGSAAAWARRTFVPEHSFDELEPLLLERWNTGDPAARPLCLPGLTGERTPVRNNNARGTFVGVTENTDGIDLYLAVLTGVALGLRHAADAMGQRPTRLPVVGGGSASAVWRQILADAFDTTIVLRAASDPGIRSVAIAAAEAITLPNSLVPLFDGENDSDLITVPGPNRHVLAKSLPLHRALYQALDPTFHQLHN